MLISQSKKFLFVHIQKTAGRSFEAVLSTHIPDLKNICRTHDHTIRAKELLDDEWSQYYDEWSQYYKVAFVRNIEFFGYEF